MLDVILSDCRSIAIRSKHDGNYTRMLRTILNKSWRQHPTKHHPPIAKTILVRQTRHAGHCWRSRDELISDELLWTPTYGRAKAGQPARTYVQQLCNDTECSPKDLPEAMNDREKWWERVMDICAGGTTWWWWWWYCQWLWVINFKATLMIPPKFSFAWLKDTTVSPSVGMCVSVCVCVCLNE